MLIAACGSTSSTPPVPPSEDAAAPVCPAGPNAATAPASELPAGSCYPSEGPCSYRGTPCPSVPTGTVNSYLCTCESGTWDCEIEVQVGLCSQIPEEGGTEDASIYPDASFDAAFMVPIGPTGPAQP
jgi:hypothetical protein